METSPQTHSLPTDAQPQWRPLTAKQRRVLGTLMEKSKTTPDAYPMTISALATGCNQKTNRAPITNLTTDQIEKVIDELRAMGALAIIQGSGRVEKIRHYAYQWLGISKVEAAVMTELLLRGEQTLGELRGRAARMEPIADLAELQTIMNPLIERKLVIELTAAGRGQIVSHNLYEEWELNQLQASIANSLGSIESSADERVPADASRNFGSSLRTNSSDDLQQQLERLSHTVEKLAGRLARLEKELGISSEEV